MIKFTNEELATPLTHIINLSIKFGKFSDHLKITKIIQVFKSGNKRDINNYRPISILPAFSKIYEKVIADRLKSYLESNRLLTESQHGFRKNRSTETAVLYFINKVYGSLEEKLYSVGIFIALSKAFD